MSSLATSPRLRPDNHAQDDFLDDVLAGLRAPQKRLSAKYFYDEIGSQLFEQITEAPEYYPTRCEMAVLAQHAAGIARLVPEGAAIVEFGSGSNRKARLLLRETPKLAAYVPVDISGEMLFQEASDLRRDFPDLPVLPVIADFTRPFTLPRDAQAARRRVGFFPGSTIGNFEPAAAIGFLKNAAQILGPGAALIVGADLVKDIAVIEAAYNDAAGVTAQFNLNVLARINRELDGTFDLAQFAHRAFFNSVESRIEMHLVSRKRQTARIGRHSVEFRDGETIHTENSYKFSVDTLGDLARRAGWSPAGVWTDDRGYFSVQAFALSAAGSQAAERIDRVR